MLSVFFSWTEAGSISVFRFWYISSVINGVYGACNVAFNHHLFFIVCTLWISSTYELRKDSSAKTMLTQCLQCRTVMLFKMQTEINDEIATTYSPPSWYLHVTFGHLIRNHNISISQVIFAFFIFGGSRYNEESKFKVLERGMHPPSHASENLYYIKYIQFFIVPWGR